MSILPSDTSIVQSIVQLIVNSVGVDTTLKWVKSCAPTTSPETTIQHVPSSVSSHKKPRGRRPGAASEEHRCAWEYHAGTRCKNKQSEDSSYCKIHDKKATLVKKPSVTLLQLPPSGSATPSYGGSDAE
jgi:hypothetical protein